MNQAQPRSSNQRAHAIVWDFDGTLVDTRLRNMVVTRSIIEQVAGQPWQQYAALSSLDNYKQVLLRTANWRDLYAHEFGLSESDVDRAGRLWPEYQARETTPAPFFGGIPEVLERWQELPQGIVSQNDSAIITGILEANNLKNFFRAIIGYEDVEFRLQKPAPEGLIHCIDLLTGLQPGLVFSIGDHETDARCAKMGQEILTDRHLDIKMISIGAFYGSEPSPQQVDSFDHAAYQTEELTAIIQNYLTESSAGH